MKYDLISQIKDYLKEQNNSSKLNNVSNEIKLLHDSNIPELNGIRIDKNGRSSVGIPLISVTGKKFVLYNNLDSFTIESTDSIFCVSTSEKKLFLQCSIENDIIKSSLEDSNLFIHIYTDVLKNGKFIDNLKNLIPDTVQSINIEFKDKETDKDNKRILIIKDNDKKYVIKVPVNMSLINIIRLISNVIRLEYRKNSGFKEIKQLIK